ncbi:MAG: hypothetical protein PUG09_11250 [Prevotella sp.]|nr:hypothetical protein [Prevotella sp.]
MAYVAPPYGVDVSANWCNIQHPWCTLSLRVALPLQHLSSPADLEEMAERSTMPTRVDMRAAKSMVLEFVES